jgi:aryl-alcohol dehydrogenase-like predicted oxidoreductase
MSSQPRTEGTNTLQTRTLGRSGLEVSAIGLGLSRLTLRGERYPVWMQQTVGR